MEPISFEGTPKTPTVNFNPDTGIVEIKGRSIPENSIEFYKPLVDWLEEYKDNAQPMTKDVYLMFLRSLRLYIRRKTRLKFIGTMKRMMKICWKQVKIMSRLSGSLLRWSKLLSKNNFNIKKREVV